MDMVKGLEGKMYGELSFLDLFSPEQRRVRGGLIVCSSSQGAEEQCWALLSGDSDRAWGDGMELGYERVRLSVRKKLFTKRFGHWTASPRQWSWLQAWQSSWCSQTSDFCVVLSRARTVAGLSDLYGCMVVFRFGIFY